MLFYQNQYFQGSLTNERAGEILELLDTDCVPDLRHIIKDLTASQITAIQDAYKNGEEIPVYEDSYGTLSDMQTVGVQFMYLSQRCLLGDQVGLGKTVESAGLMNLLYSEKGYRTLFLTEKTIVPQISMKLIKFTGRYVDTILNAEKRQLQKFFERMPNGFEYDVVGSHSLLQSSEFLYYCSLHPIDCLIIDEGYILKNTTSTYYKNAVLLAKKAKYVIILNATPLETEARNIYNQLKLLDKHFMPTVAEFEQAYCVKRPNVFGGGWSVVGYKNTNVFKKAITLRYLARTRDDVGALIKGNAVRVLYVPMTNVQKALERKTTLHQMVADYPTGVDFTIPYTMETTGKLEALVSLFLGECSGEKVLLYSRFIECQSKIVEELRKVGRKPVILNGSCSTGERDLIIKDFNLGVYDVLVTNIARGYDLDGCDRCIIYTLDANPQKLVQLFGRLTRDENIVGKTLYMMVSEGKEKQNFVTSSKMRATASMQFTRVGTNLVLQAIADG